MPTDSLAQTAQDYSGIYVRFDGPVFETKAFKEYNSELKDNFPSLSEVVAFPGAQSEILKNVLFYQLPANDQYASLESYLQGQPIIDEILLEDLQIGEVASTVKEMDDEHIKYLNGRSFTQDCTTPYDYDDPGTLLTEHVNNMELPCAWTVTQGDPSITIAVVDNFFYPDHPDLAGRFSNVTSCNNPPSSQASHGTATSGAAAGIVDNGLCVAGGSFSSRLDAYCWNDGLLNAMWTAHRLGRPIITLSAWSTAWSSTNPMVREVFQEIVDGGTVITYSVRGNNAINFADIDGLLVVGMAWADGWFRTYDNGVPDLNIDMVVPSRNISRLNEFDCAIGQGNTSISTPYLAGTIALMLSVNPCLTPVDVERILKSTSKPIPNPESTFGQVNGGGNLNAYRAVLASIDFTGQGTLVVGPGDIKTINGEHLQYSSIKVQSGGRLNILNGSKIIIEGDEYNDGRVVVERGAKLIIRNSTLTSPSSFTCPKGKWEGIRVHGNIDREQPNMFNVNGQLEVNAPIAINDAGVVMLLDETVIENARNAVATSVPGMPYQDQIDRWGGLVIADRAIFRNNFRAAEFLPYPRQFSGNTFKNKSVFNECLFINTDEQDTRSLGITAWDTDGITITKFTFKNIGRESLVTIDGSFIVENGNTFINEIGIQSHRHIMSMATYPYSGASMIGSNDQGLLRNEFYSNNPRDIFVSSSTSAGQGGVQVVNNDFYGSDNSRVRSLAVEIDGPAAYLLKGNFVEASRPFEIRNTGSNQFSRGNLVTCNTINNSRGSIAFRSDNSGSKFRSNTFTGDGVNFRPAILVDGVVDLFQGNVTRPANNRFETTQTVLDISVSSSSTPFLYYYTSHGGANNPFFPRGVSNYVKNETIFDGLPDCSFGRPPVSGIKERDVLAAHMKYESLRNSANPNIPQEVQQVDGAKVNRDNLINDFVDLALKERSLSKINSLLSKIPGPEAKMRHFGACVELRDYAGARSLLSVIGGFGSSYNDFVDVQQVNLDRLQTTGQEYVIAESDFVMLDNIASSESNVRGYARAVLYLLKDVRYYDSYEDKVSGGLQEGSKTKVLTDLKSSLVVYPNPVTNGIIRMTGEIIQGDVVVTIRRIDGSVLSVNKLTGVQEITVNSPEKSGIYFIEVTSGEQVATSKVVVR